MYLFVSKHDIFWKISKDKLRGNFPANNLNFYLNHFFLTDIQVKFWTMFNVIKT